MMVSKNSLTLEIVFNDSVSDDFLWFLATPPRPPAEAPEAPSFRLLLFIIIIVMFIMFFDL